MEVRQTLAFSCFPNTLCSKATELTKSFLTFIQLTDLKLNIFEKTNPFHKNIISSSNSRYNLWSCKSILGNGNLV